MVTENMVYDALREVLDPDVMMNIVDLGLVYGVDIDGSNVTVTMTLTTPACPIGPQIIHNVEQEVEAVEGVEKVTVNLVWEPMWTPEMMSDIAKLELGYEI
jgi:metal-sulfur cluster biosynthetic enzyme